ncbi:helix-turn-helix domain-containing protein [Maribacter sp. HTCC2170]|uniref:helix-turn-helix domain-containing protein n=1 Tax=Maribacter sp. (strain HTCC2170 / KCCM 42371) TaxID=313603 RepID=UPI00006BD5D4|nr:helix-turn-helix domain-containing protein [Maribacter sp. HTCC2170]EAR02683.1 probable serine/threonine kinase [Maribacter sp. HTCC2170]
MSTNHKLDDSFQKKSSGGTLVDKLTQTIESNLNNEQFGVDDLAQAVGMSRSSLHRKLQKLLGISTSQFIREYRLKRALEILRNERVTASEAAYRVGFSSPTYFNTCFHKFYGFTPGEVKSKTNDEIEGLISGESTKTVRKSTNKKLLWAIFLVPAILLVIYYFFGSDTTQHKESLTQATAIDNKSIVVLPIKNWTGNPELEYISDGMTDAIISRLTKIEAIDKVVPFTSALQYKQTEKTLQEIGKELGVANVLQGNLQISGDQIKINLQLIHGRSDVHLWSEEYMKEWKSDEIFKIQTEVVEAIAKNMSATISENELAAIQKIPTQSKQAYSYFLQAEFQRNKANESTYKNAIALYQKTIEIDSNFVEAYTSQARVWSFGGLVWGIFDEQIAWENTKKLLEKALELDPDNAAVEEELYSGYYYFDWDFEKVEPYYQRLLKDPYYDDTPSINADYAIKTGRYQEAIDDMNEFLMIDPSFGVLFCFKAEANLFLDKKSEAFDLLETNNSLYDDNLWYLRESAKIYFYLGEYEKSKVQLHKILTKFPDYPPILMWLNAVYAQMDGDSKNTAKYLAELHAAYNAGSSGSPAWFLAMYYCSLEDYEAAFKWLQKSYDRHEVEMTWIREEPLLAPLRNDPRYKELYDKVGFSSIGLAIKSTSEF